MLFRSVSAAQGSESAICIHMTPLGPPSCPLHTIPLSHHRALRCAPCVIQRLPTSYLFYTWECIYPWLKKIPQRRERLSTPVFLPGEPLGQRNLVGYSPCGRKEFDTTKRLMLSLLTNFPLLSFAEGMGGNAV